MDGVKQDIAQVMFQVMMHQREEKVELVGHYQVYLLHFYTSNSCTRKKCMDCCCRTNGLFAGGGGGHVDFADGPSPDNGGAGGGGHGQNPQNATGETPGVYGTGGGGGGGTPSGQSGGSGIVIIWYPKS